jgi:copper homeostasis protein
MKINPPYGLEVCANSFTSALAAEKGGAMRVELCENMAEGGTTPSYSQIKLAKTHLSIEVWPIIRPRGGDFLYSDIEFELMKEDVKVCKSLACDGVVIGILTVDGEIDEARCSELIKLAHPMPVAFHRAFDMCNDLEKALTTLISLGVVRVLTSGGEADALAGAEKINELIKLANDQIEIMPGAGIKPQNIAQLRNFTNARVFHASARVKVASEMKFRNQTTKMGNVDDEYSHEQTSTTIVKEIINNLKSI